MQGKLYGCKGDSVAKLVETLSYIDKEYSARIPAPKYRV